MELIERIEQLETAHRALSAQHMALKTICEIMLPLIDADPAYTRSALTIAYDTLSALMQEHRQDDEYQAEVRRRFDAMADPIDAAANNRTLRRNPGESD